MDIGFDVGMMLGDPWGLPETLTANGYRARKLGSQVIPGSHIRCTSTAR